MNQTPEMVYDKVGNESAFTDNGNINNIILDTVTAFETGQSEIPAIYLVLYVLLTLRHSTYTHASIIILTPSMEVQSIKGFSVGISREMDDGEEKEIIISPDMYCRSPRCSFKLVDIGILTTEHIQSLVREKIGPPRNYKTISNQCSTKNSNCAGLITRIFPNITCSRFGYGILPDNPKHCKTTPPLNERVGYAIFHEYNNLMEGERSLDEFMKIVDLKQVPTRGLGEGVKNKISRYNMARRQHKHTSKCRTKRSKCPARKTRRRRLKGG